MKRLFLICVAATFLLAACNSNKTKDSKTTDESKTESSAASADKMTAGTADDAQQKMEELKKLPALTTDQLKALLPEELGGMKRKSSSVSANLGYGIGTAEYRSDDANDGKELRLSIFDCVGEAGVGWYNMMYWGYNMETEDENGYQKTTTFNGNKAIEKYEKNQDQYTLMFPASNRLLVNLEGEKIGLDAVKQAANSLNLKSN